MRRLLLVLTVALMMAVMLVAMAPGPVVAAGKEPEGFAKGRENTNPGFVKDAKGDLANDACVNTASGVCNPDDFGVPNPNGKPKGEGTGSN